MLRTVKSSGDSEEEAYSTPTDNTLESFFKLDFRMGAAPITEVVVEQRRVVAFDGDGDLDGDCRLKAVTLLRAKRQKKQQHSSCKSSNERCCSNRVMVRFQRGSTRQSVSKWRERMGENASNNEHHSIHHEMR